MCNWDDIIIGWGDKGSTAIRVFDIEGEHSISQNTVSYWVSGLIYNFGMTIFKGSPEGIDLTDMINAKKPLSEINEYLEGLVFKHADVKVLKSRIDEYADMQYRRGQEKMRKKMCKLLGL